MKSRLFIKQVFIIALILTACAPSVSQKTEAAPSTGTQAPPPEKLDDTLAPFAKALGNWEGVDVGFDGSAVTMKITRLAKNQYYIQYHDEAATICGKDPNGKLYPADGFGTEITKTKNLLVQIKISCLSVPPSSWGVIDFVFLYDSSADTITDNSGVVWYRSRRHIHHR